MRKSLGDYGKMLRLELCMNGISCAPPQPFYFSDSFVATRFLPLQQIDWLAEVRGAHILRQRRMLAFKREVHLPRNTPIAEVSRRRGSQFTDVLRLGKVHLEEATNPRSQR